MALRFDSPALESGLLFAAPDEFIGEPLQEVTGSGTWALQLTAGFSGSGVLPQQVYNIGGGEGHLFAFELTPSFQGTGSVNQPDEPVPAQQVTGSGVFGSQLQAAFEGSGVITTPQQVTGSGVFELQLQTAFTGVGGLIIPQQVTGTGVFASQLTVSFEGLGAVKIPQEVTGTGVWASELTADFTGLGRLGELPEGGARKPSGLPFRSLGRMMG